MQVSLSTELNTLQTQKSSMGESRGRLEADLRLLQEKQDMRTATNEKLQRELEMVSDRLIQAQQKHKTELSELETHLRAQMMSEVEHLEGERNELRTQLEEVSARLEKALALRDKLKQLREKHQAECSAFAAERERLAEEQKNALAALEQKLRHEFDQQMAETHRLHAEECKQLADQHQNQVEETRRDGAQVAESEQLRRLNERDEELTRQHQGALQQLTQTYESKLADTERSATDALRKSEANCESLRSELSKAQAEHATISSAIAELEAQLAAASKLRALCCLIHVFP